MSAPGLGSKSPAGPLFKEKPIEKLLPTELNSMMPQQQLSSDPIRIERDHLGFPRRSIQGLHASIKVNGSSGPDGTF